MGEIQNKKLKEHLLKMRIFRAVKIETLGCEKFNYANFFIVLPIKTKIPINL
jgi:hypothetical protein